MAKHNLDEAEWQSRAGHQRSILFTEDDFSSKGTKLTLIKIPPATKIEPHYHQVRTEAFYVLNGSGIIMQDEEELACSVNDYLLSKPGTIHAFENNGIEDFIIAIFRTNDSGDTDMFWINEPKQD